MPTKSIGLEAIYPQAVAEQWGTERLATAAGVSAPTARDFMRRKLAHASALSDKVIFKLTIKAGAIFHDASMRQLRRLEALNKLPDDHVWTRMQYFEERTAIALLKPLMDWCKLRMDASPGDAEPPQLSDGL